jgi:NAD(P)-dependent dehydrogenase (short-subunit alcohol dehydrogenase family)
MSPLGEGRFAGARAIVTGAARGIGLAVAARLQREGALVAGLDLDTSLHAGGVAEWGPGIHAITADVSNPQAIESAFAQGIALLGGIDILVNNAGIQIPGHIALLAIEDWDRLHSVNLRGAWLTIRTAYPHLRESKSGCIVNVASIDGLTGEAGVAAYCAAKAGLVNLTRGAALDLASDGIRVNVVCPGMTDTPMLRHFLDQSTNPDADLAARVKRIPLQRLVQPEEVAAAVLFLASPEASGITGACLTVDNGLTAGWDYAAPAVSG